MDGPRITPARTRQAPAALLSLALAAALLAGCGSATSSKPTAEGDERSPVRTPAQTAEAEVKPSNLEGEAKKREAAFERELAQRRREAAAAEAAGSGKHAHKGAHKGGGHKGGGHKGGGHKGGGHKGGGKHAAAGGHSGASKGHAGESAAEQSARRQFAREEAAEAKAAG
jgi:uncharacterized membrane protein YgcG